jgi:4-hydroxybenzoate polyprenyltransferase
VLHIKTVYDGLRIVFADWATLPESVAIRGGDAIRAYKASLAGRFGYEIGLGRLADADLRVKWTAEKNFDALVALARGDVAPGPVRVMAGLALAVLVLAAWQLNRFVLTLLPAAVVFLVGYSYTKRFTWASHWVLGVTDGMAVAGAWAAVTGSLSHPAPWLLWLTVTFWMAGFDIIYACQDTDFDRTKRLRSVPACFGNATALRWAKVNHGLCVLTLAAAGLSLQLGWAFWAGVAGVAALLAWENSLVTPNDLSRVNLAFFNVNGYISVLIFLAAWLGLYW